MTGPERTGGAERTGGVGRTGGVRPDPLPVSLDVSAVPASPAGAGRYTLELATALAGHPEVALTLVARRHDAARWEALAGAPGATVVPVAPGPRPLRLGWEQLGLPGVLRRSGVAVHHGPHYTMPERASVPVVVTVHDCTFFDHPEWHERSKVLLFRRAIKVAARRAAVIVCVSATTAARLAEVCPVSAPVVVAPHGVDHARFTPREPSPGADRAAVAALGLDPDRPMVVFVGTIEPRKNVPALVRAFEQVADAHPDAVLVLAGQRGWGADEVERAEMAAERHRDRIVRTGYVPDGAVPALLRTAAVVAYPSLAEGYGLPALEALACGAPLVTTSGTAMAELADGAAVLVAPGDTADLASAIDGVLSDDGGGGTADRRRRGLEVAAARTWEASAQRHLQAYRRAAR
ncbi:MAG TPA: glycosyltransferase family 1 protein [Acidimicrobiales bacterium]|nr:glycosyltransferase family 1 protein [Acidimicrobiales bacterium]